VQHSRRRPDEFARRDRRGGVRATAQALVDRLDDVVVTQGGVVSDGLKAIHTDARDRRVLLESRVPLALRAGPAELRAAFGNGHVRIPALVLNVDTTVATVHLDVARAVLGGRRRDERFPLMLPVEGAEHGATNGNGAGWSSLTRNVSAGGVLVRARLAAGSRHHVTLGLPGLELALEAIALRQSDDGTALSFDELAADARHAVRCALLRTVLHP
jgi:PilZ domain-containing protein